MKKLASLLAALLILAGCATMGGGDMKPLETVPKVDLNRYAGKWFEIARYPFYFQNKCADSTAEYTLREDGRIDVVNRCRVCGTEDKFKESRAIAWSVDPQTNSKLKVRFFWPFSGDYWIIDLDDNYEYAVVSGPKRKYLWILARAPRLNKEQSDKILSRLTEMGFDNSRLIWNSAPISK